MTSRIYSSPSRYICSVLDEMRDCHKTHNYSYLPGLIEEAQSLARRMESALCDVRDVREWSKIRDELKKEIRELEEKKRLLDEQLPKT